MSTLLLRLEGVMQSWSISAAATPSQTLDRPTKCGVIGMVAAALGRSRGDDIGDLAALEFSARSDRPGYVVNDYQTSGGGTMPVLLGERARAGSRLDPVNAGYSAARKPELVDGPAGRFVQATWDPNGPATTVSSRYYLSDAAFLVGLRSTDEDLLLGIALALMEPRWYPRLGRRGCIPTEPVLYRDELIPDAVDWAIEEPLLPRSSRSTARMLREVHRSTPGAKMSREAPITFGDQPVQGRAASYGRMYYVTSTVEPRTPGEGEPS